jgi:hypothetical protein
MIWTHGFRNGSGVVGDSAPADWHPNADHDARIAAEGLYIDPIQQFTTLDEEQDAPVSPDFDL